MITASEDRLERARAMLGHLPGVAERAMARALNRAVLTARKAAVEQIRATYAVAANDLRNAITVFTATPEKLSAGVVARSPSMPMSKFPIRPSQPGTGGKGKPVLRAEIKRGAAKNVPSAFVVRFKSGHVGVVIRTGEKTSAGKVRLQELFSTPLAVMLGVESVKEYVEAEALATLDVRLAHEIERELGKVA